MIFRDPVREHGFTYWQYSERVAQRYLETLSELANFESSHKAAKPEKILDDLMKLHEHILFVVSYLIENGYEIDGTKYWDEYVIDQTYLLTGEGKNFYERLRFIDAHEKALALTNAYCTSVAQASSYVYMANRELFTLATETSNMLATYVETPAERIGIHARYLNPLVAMNKSANIPTRSFDYDYLASFAFVVMNAMLRGEKLQHIELTLAQSSGVPLRPLLISLFENLSLVAERVDEAMADIIGGNYDDLAPFFSRVSSWEEEIHCNLVRTCNTRGALANGNYSLSYDVFKDSSHSVDAEYDQGDPFVLHPSTVSPSQLHVVDGTYTAQKPLVLNGRLVLIDAAVADVLTPRQVVLNTLSLN